MEVNEAVELKVVDGGIMICKDETRDKKIMALESLRSIRTKHLGAADVKEKDYRAAYEEYLDERYSR